MMDLTSAKDFLEKLEQSIDVPVQATFRLVRTKQDEYDVLGVTYLVVGVVITIIAQGRPHMFGVTEVIRDIADHNSLNHQIHMISAKFMDGLRKQPKEIQDILSRGKGPTVG
jgi:hypothetical protein